MSPDSGPKIIFVVFITTFGSKPGNLFIATEIAQVGEDRVGIGADGLSEFHLLIEREVLERGEQVAVEDALGDGSRDRVVLDDPVNGEKVSSLRAFLRRYWWTCR